MYTPANHSYKVHANVLALISWRPPCRRLGSDQHRGRPAAGADPRVPAPERPVPALAGLLAVLLLARAAPAAAAGPRGQDGSEGPPRLEPQEG